MIIIILSFLTGIMIIYFFVLINQLIIHLKNKFYRPIVLGQFGFFFLLFSILIMRLTNFDQNITIYENIHFLTLLVRLGAISGLLGVVFWLNAIELLDFTDFLILSKNITLKKLPFILIGITIASVSTNLDVSLVTDHYELYFRNMLVYILLITSFAIIVLEQLSFLISRLKTRTQTVISTSFNDKRNTITLLYLFFIFFTFIVSVAQFVNIFDESFPVWLIFSIFSQLLFSYLLFTYPSLFVTTEEPLLFMILSEAGIAIYTKNFGKKFVFPYQMIAGYLKALDSLGSNVLLESGNVISVIFQENSTLLVRTLPIQGKNFKICYIHRGISYLAPLRIDSFIRELALDNDVNKEILESMGKGRILLADTLELLIAKIFDI